MERSHEDAQLEYTKFSYALEQLQRTLRPALSAVDSLRSAGNEEDLDPLSRARMHIALAYAVNSLFCMYLRTQGIEPSTHPVAEEIARVQDAFMRMRKVEVGESTDHKPKPDRDRRKHIVNAKKSATRLAALVFPEEEDLLRALQGKPGRLESKREGKITGSEIEKNPAHAKDSKTKTPTQSENVNFKIAENERQKQVNEATEFGGDDEVETESAIQKEIDEVRKDDPDDKVETRSGIKEEGKVNEVMKYDSDAEFKTGSGIQVEVGEVVDPGKDKQDRKSTLPTPEERTTKKKSKKDRKEKEQKKKKEKRKDRPSGEEKESHQKGRTKSKKRKSKSDISSSDKREKKRKKRDKQKTL
ncbi:unnamed protein product [Agarophyton chilense]